ncbi:hypothetical protein [Kitasatospora sp. NPDC101183]|uniref:hypothetical protein n=1 Tax=Kitasatospora sp. NPDC101183 TaxID=3364100 RepID=UPI00382C058F
MSEYQKDKDGDVWRVDGVWLTNHRYAGDVVGYSEPEHRDEVTRRWGPLVPCTEDGSPLTPEPLQDVVRALVAAAFEDLAEAAYTAHRAARYPAEEAAYDGLHDAAIRVANGVLSGEIRPRKVAE